MKPKNVLLLLFMLMNSTSFAALDGLWKAQLDINGSPLTFYLRFNSPINAQIECGGEVIKIDEISLVNDSLFLKLPVFDTEFRLKVAGNKITGVWVNNYLKTANVIGFEANKIINSPIKKLNSTSINGRWKTTFSPNKAEKSEALGIFEQTLDGIKGTFLTPTGDYRFLEGEMNGNEFSLSAFDGSHAFLFRGKVEKDSIKGIFSSGIHYVEEFVAVRDSKFELPDSDKLTFLKDGFDKINFEFPDLEGEKVKLSDEKFKNKVVIVQVMGSWCPNCMDETKFLADYYEKNKEKGIEIIALSFEKPIEFEKAAANVKRLKTRFNAGYTFLIAGNSTKIDASKKLPMLNSVLAFPTTIFIDKKGKVRKIHTGFNGPATGVYFEQFINEFELFTKKLLSE